MSLSINAAGMPRHADLLGVRPGWRSVGYAAIAMILALNVLDIVPPLQDYGDWVYQGFLLKLLMAGHGVLVTFKPWPVPNALSQLILAADMFLVSPIVAAKTFICVYLVLFALLCDRLTTARDGSRFVLLVLLGVVNSTFWNGYVNFQLGLLILLFYVCLRREGRHLPLPVEMLFGVSIFFSHAICLGAFLVYVGCDSLLRRRLARGFAVLAPALLLVVWYALANSSTMPDVPPLGHGGLAAFASYKLYTMAKLGPYQNFIVDGVGDHTRHALLYAAGVLVNFGFALLFVVPLSLCAIAMMVQRQFTPEVMTALICFGGFLILPSTLFGIVNIGERALAVAAVLAVIAVKLPDWTLRSGAALACLMPLTIVSVLAGTIGVTHDRPLSSAAINDPHQRNRLLFWHRAFEFLDEVQMAQRSALSGTPPTSLPGFDTSILARRGG
jgi:hypothetical protein